MVFRVRWFFVVLFFLFLPGCAHVISKDLRDTADPAATFQRVFENPNAYKGKTVVWGGEMGRLPIAQLPSDKDPSKAGRDHNKNAICTWLAGGGVKSGFVRGTKITLWA